MVGGSHRMVPEAEGQPPDARRVVKLHHVPHDPQLRWQVIDESTGIYLAGFADRDTAKRYIDRHGWTVADI